VRLDRAQNDPVARVKARSFRFAKADLRALGGTAAQLDFTLSPSSIIDRSFFPRIHPILSC